ncbi:Sel1 repeat family [Verrucomicrobiia bacterium DG1235]|nr:Sel1 repeat family [Verrucomicrobiae bacterium DG1235]
MNPHSLRPLLALITIALLAHPGIRAQDFDYGESELSPEERYDDALKHLYGADGYKKNRGEAVSLLKKAANQDFAPAHNMLGLLSLEGNGLFASPRKALRSFEQAASLGDTLGHYNAGYAYLIGRGTRSSMAQAEKFFLSVVDADSLRNLSPEDFGTIRNARASAYFYLGLIYGDEDDADFYHDTKATDMFLKADELNEPSAAMLLAIRYARGEGAEQDQEKSGHFLERYKIAAVNKLHNSFSQVFFQGMDRESIKDTVDDIVESYEDQMTKRIQSMQTSFGVSLLDEEDLFSPEQAFVWLEPVAVKDNPLACSRLATLYYRGEGTEQNFEKARELLELSHKQNTMAQYNLAVMLAQGQGGEQDLERAQLLLERAAADSWYPALHFPNANEAPFITERDAIDLVQQQARERKPEALYCLGRRTLWGIGVERDFEPAKAMILASAEMGNARARYFYGVYIASDFSWLGATDEDKAIQAAADAGYPPAIHHRGQKAETAGRYPLALENYQRAADMGHSLSVYKLGKFYRDGLGLERDYAKAIDYFRQAADMDDAIGFLNLGLAHEYGLGIDKNPTEAYRLYQEAIDLGSYFAHYTMGNLLASGKLGEAAWEEAIPYWEKAADYRVKHAMLRLGDCYREGRGVSKNLNMARNYYYGAFNVSYYGDNDSTFHLAQLLIIPESEEYAPKKALGDLRLLELSGYPLAGYQLGIMNMRGIALKQNPKKAYNKFLKVARSLGTDLKTGLGQDYSQYYNPEVKLEKSAPPVDRETEILRETALDACFHIARILSDGKIKKTDPADSLTWYNIAAQLGHSEAQLELGKLYLTGKYVEKNQEVAWSWILKSASRSADAKYFAASRYFEGKYESLGRDKAAELLRSAAAAGHERSSLLLEKEGLSLEPDDKPATPNLPQREGQDDGFDGPIDLDVA